MVWWKQNIGVGFKNYYSVLSYDRPVCIFAILVFFVGVWAQFEEITMGTFQVGAGPLLPIILALPYDQLVLNYGSM
jgi:hypothetical protein